MGNIADAFTSGLQGAPVGGTTDSTGAATAGVSPAGADAFGGFGNFNDIINTLSGGSGGLPPLVSNATAQAPASVDASSGTQSNVSPGGRNAPEQNQQQQQDDPNAPQAPPQAIQDQLRALLEKVVGKPSGPTGMVPQPPHTPTVPGALNALFGNQAANARTPPPDQVGRDITVQPKQKPAPPYEPGDTGPPPAPQTTQLGPEAAPPAPAPPADQPGPPVQLPQGPVTPPAAPISPAEAYPQHTSRLQQDLAGLSLGNPKSLAQLALDLAGVLGPLAIAFGKGGRPGVDYAGGYAEALDMLHPKGADEAQGHAEAAAHGLTDKNGNPSPTGAFDKSGAFVAAPDKTPVSNQIPGVTPQIADNYWRQAAQKRGMDPNVASKVLGAESSYGQNNVNQRDVNAYPDYGPPQLNMAPGALGDQFYKQTGINPRDFAQGDNWKKMTDFALDHVMKEGWTDLYPGTSKRLGLGRWTGIPHKDTGIQGPISILSHPPTQAGGSFTLPGENIGVG